MSCLFTKHKTQKRKVWNDGRLVLISSKAILYDADPPPGSNDPILGECEISNIQMQNILAAATTTLEMERYLVEVEGPWSSSSSSSSLLSQNAPPVVVASASASARNRRRPKAVSSSMNKLMTSSKFKTPKPYIPPRSSVRPDNKIIQILGKRQRPLQPGELVAMHHGGGGNGNGNGNDGGYPHQRGHHNDHQRQH